MLHYSDLCNLTYYEVVEDNYLSHKALQKNL